MIFIANAEGTITDVIDEPVYQGSNGTSRVVLLAPFDNVSVAVAFRLPNGVLTDIDFVTPNMVETEIGGEVVNKEGARYNAWLYLLPLSVTQYAGKLSVQFFVYEPAATADETPKILSTYTTVLTIQRGVAPQMPTVPTQNIYDKILQYLAYIQDNIKQIIPIETVTVLPTTNINEWIIYRLDKGASSEYWVYKAGDTKPWQLLNDKFTKITENGVVVDTETASVAPANNSLLKRTADGRAKGNDPIEEDDLVNKRFLGQAQNNHAILINRDLPDQHPIEAITNLQSELDKKLDKETSLTTDKQVYAKSESGAQEMINISSGASADTIVKRDSQGHIEVNAAATNTQAVNRGQMDSADATTLNAAKTYTDNKITGIFRPQGSINFAELPAQPIAADLGFVWNIKDEFTTDNRFMEVGNKIFANSNVAVVQDGSEYKFDVIGTIFDMQNYYNKSETDAKFEQNKQALDNKVSKTKKKQSIYGTAFDGSGDTIFLWAQPIYSLSTDVVVTDGNGQLNGKEPVSGANMATKNYVDNNDIEIIEMSQSEWEAKKLTPEHMARITLKGEKVLIKILAMNRSMYRAQSQMQQGSYVYTNEAFTTAGDQSFIANNITIATDGSFTVAQHQLKKLVVMKLQPSGTLTEEQKKAITSNPAGVTINVVGEYDGKQIDIALDYASKESATYYFTCAIPDKPAIGQMITYIMTCNTAGLAYNLSDIVLAGAQGTGTIVKVNNVPQAELAAGQGANELALYDAQGHLEVNAASTNTQAVNRGQVQTAINNSKLRLYKHSIDIATSDTDSVRIIFNSFDGTKYTAYAQIISNLDKLTKYGAFTSTTVVDCPVISLSAFSTSMRVHYITSSNTIERYDFATSFTNFTDTVTEVTL